jgi:hypothetical protein
MMVKALVIMTVKRRASQQGMDDYQDPALSLNPAAGA